MLMKKTASFEFQKCLIWSRFGRSLQIDPEAKRMEKKIYYDTVYSSAGIVHYTVNGLNLLQIWQYGFLSFQMGGTK